MTFKVDPPALEQVAALLDRNRGHIPDLKGYINRHLRQGTAAQLRGQGLFLWCSYDHDEQVERAVHRLRWIDGVWHSAAVTFLAAARRYRAVDASAAARLDALHPLPGNDPGAVTGPLDRRAAVFQDVWDPSRGVANPPADDIAALEPRAAAIATWVGAVNDLVSMNWWARRIVKEIYGRDPFEEAIQLLTGDWKVFARYAAGWLHVANSVDALRHNVEHTDDALAAHWEGHAADAALVHLRRLHLAMGHEVDFYDKYLVGLCKAYVDVAFYAYEILNYLVGQLLDVVLETVAILAGIVTEGLSILAAAVVSLGDAIMFTVDFFRQVYHAGKLVSAVAGVPGEPPLSIADLLLPDPDPGGRNCIVVPAGR